MSKPEECPLYQINDSTGELTLFVRCKLCSETVWDRSKDGPVQHDALAMAGAAHLTIRHADLYEVRPDFKGLGNKCPTCGHPYKWPEGACGTASRCLEIVVYGEEPGSTICGCTDSWHTQPRNK